MNTYGKCPQCGTDSISRERRPNGNDKCANGHTYPSANAIQSHSGGEAVAWINEQQSGVITSKHKDYLNENYPDSPNDKINPLYLAPPQPQSAKDALEKAALHCEALSKLYPREDVGFDKGYSMGTARAAKEIRALIEHDAPSAPIEAQQSEPINEVYYFEKWLYANTLCRANLNIELEYADQRVEMAYRAWKARKALIQSTQAKESEG